MYSRYIGSSLVNKLSATNVTGPEWISSTHVVIQVDKKRKERHLTCSDNDNQGS